MIEIGAYALSSLMIVQPANTTAVNRIEYPTAVVQYQNLPSLSDPVFDDYVLPDEYIPNEYIPNEVPYLPEQPTMADLPLIPEATVLQKDSVGKTKEASNFRETPTVAGKIIKKLPKGTTVQVLDSAGGFYKVQESDKVGYVFKDQIETSFVKELPVDLSNATVIGTYTTKFSLGDINRNHNMEMACMSATGLLKAGETFSYLKRVGRAGKADGYLPAGVISGGKLVTGYGGGICQPSSTLYAALLQVKPKTLTVLERYPHSLPVGYVPRGMDATVSNPSADFRFRNDTGFDVYVDIQANAYKGTIIATYYQLN